MSLPDWQIVTDDDGHKQAVGGPVNCIVLDKGGELFKRGAIKNFGTPNAEQVRWLVAKLDGVHVFFDGDNIIVTKQDLYP